MRIGIGLGLTGLRGVPADPFADLYGTGMGQMPMRYEAAAAMLDGSGNVTTLSNRGGAGPMFNSAASATGITISSGGIVIPANHAGFDVASSMDLIGTRLFAVCDLSDMPSAGIVDLVGTHTGNLPGDRTVLRVNRSSNVITAQRWDGAAMPSVFMSIPAGFLGPTLIEVEMTTAKASVWVNGVQTGTSTIAPTWPNFPAVRIIRGAGGTTASYRLAAALSVITDGTPALDPVMLRVRQTLAGQYGIAVA